MSSNTILRPRRANRRFVAVAVGAALLASCGGASIAQPSTTTASTGGAASSGAGRGWLDPAPKTASSSGSGASSSEKAYAMSADGATTVAKSSSGMAAPEPAPIRNQALRAGNIDDNARFEDYLSYRTRVANTGLTFRELDPTGRVVLRVTGSDSMPAAQQAVMIRQGTDVVATLTTTADGTTRFLPRAYEGDRSKPYTATVGDRSVTFNAGATAPVTLSLATPTAPSGAVKVDVLFLLDTTGSMGDEIDRLKTTIDSVAERLGELSLKPDLRVGMTVYRDLGDAYVTRTFDFTNDIASFREALAGVQAAGGGDTPEALDEALADALAKPAWRSDALGMVFLVADASPHIDRKVTTPYTDSIRAAMNRGIKIFPIASSNTDDPAEFVFRQLAQATGARFVFLSYGASGAALGTESDITKTDYEELALDDLVVRLVADELAARRGTTVTQLPPPVTSTTRPPGQ